MKAKDNQVVITHIGEPCVYEIESSQLTITHRGLDIEIFTKPNLDCPLAHLCAPKLYIESATINAKSIKSLTEEEFEVEVGWDTDEIRKEDNIFCIYISQHAALNNNKVRIVRRLGNNFELTWNAVSQNFIDFRDPDSSIEVNCVISQ